MCSQIGCLAHFTFVWTVDRVEYRSRACLTRIKTREKVPFILTVVYEANTVMGRCVQQRAHKDIKWLEKVASHLQFLC